MPTTAGPVKSGVGSKRRPFRAALMALSVPVKVVAVSSLPVPWLRVSPASVGRVSVPLSAVSETSTGLLPASKSATDRALPLAVEKNSGVFSGVHCEAGTVSTGGKSPPTPHCCADSACPR